MANKTQITQWQSVSKDKALYDKLTDSNKYQFWKFGLDNNLIRVDKVSTPVRSELSKYITPSEQDVYGRKAMASQMSTYREFEASPAQKALKKQADDNKKKQEQSRLAAQYTSPQAKQMAQQTAQFKAQEVAKRPVVAPNIPILSSLGIAKPADPKAIQAVGGNVKAKAEADKAARLARAERMVDVGRQIPEIEAEIARLKKDQGIFGTKNIGKIAQLDKQLQALKFQKSPVLAGAVDMATFGVPRELAAERARTTQGAIDPFEKASQEPGYKAGQFAGLLGRELAMYASLGNVVRSIPAVANLLKGTQGVARVGAEIGVDTLVDTVVQAPGAVIDAIANDKSIGQTAKEFAINRSIDLVLNGVINGLVNRKMIAEVFSNPQARSVIESKGITVDDVVKAVDNNDTEAIETIRDIIYVNPQGGASTDLARAEMPLDIPSGQMALPAPKVDPQEQAFTEWRKRNFGGATGKVSEQDLIALKELYKEETGIDLLRPAREVPRTVTPAQVSMPVKPTETPKLEALPSTLPNTPPTPPQQAMRPELPIKTADNRIIEQGATKPVAEATAPKLETPVVGESQSKLFERTLKMDVDAPIKAKLDEAQKRFNLDVTSNEARQSVAKQIVDDDFESALSLVRNGDKTSGSVETFVANEVIDRLNAQGRYDDITDVIASQAQKARKAGQEVQSFSQWARTSPEGIQRWAMRTLGEAGVPASEVKEFATQVYKEIKAIQSMTPEELAQMIAKQSKRKPDEGYVESLMKLYGDQGLKELNIAKAMSKITDKLPVGTSRKLSTFQAMSHLLNLKTFTRNILGNAVSFGAEQFSKIPATMADAVLSKLTGNPRTMTFAMPKYAEAFSLGKIQSQRAIAEIALGIGRAGAGDKFDTFFGSAFKSKLLQGGEKLLRYSLEAPDEFFKGVTKADHLYTSVRARLGEKAKDFTLLDLIDKATKKELEDAAEYAQFVTFQNDSYLAKMLSEAKQFLNRVNVDPLIMKKNAKGEKPKWGDVGEFGLGDFVIKYTRVPGNIMSRVVDYSPIGYARAFGGVLGASPSQQRKIAMKLGRATTGTGLMALGGALYANGLITGKGGEDYNVKAFERAEGRGEYKVNLSGLVRLIKGEDPAPKDGDQFANYNWIEPMGAPVAIGAAMAAQAKGEGIDIASLGALTAQESLDLPSLYIINKMASGLAYGEEPIDIAMMPLKEALPGFVPSVVRQAAQVLDPTVRETRAKYAGGDELANKIMANIPILSKNLPPKLDVVGRETQRQGGLIGAMLSPSTNTTFKPTGYGDKLAKIAEITGTANFYPDRNPPKTTTQDRKTYTLTPEQARMWQQIEGQEIDKLYRKYLANREITSDRRAEALAEALRELKKQASETAKKKVIREILRGK